MKNINIITIIMEKYYIVVWNNSFIIKIIHFDRLEWMENIFNYLLIGSNCYEC
jgi:hypothetical protein